MNRDDIIRMARESGLYHMPGWMTLPEVVANLERFAALIAEENDKKWQSLLVKWDEYFAVCNKGIKLSSDLSLAAIDVAIAAEREACAQVCDDYAGSNSSPSNFADRCAAAIRARGEG